MLASDTGSVYADHTVYVTVNLLEVMMKLRISRRALTTRVLKGIQTCNKSCRCFGSNILLHILSVTPNLLYH